MSDKDTLKRLKENKKESNKKYRDKKRLEEEEKENNKDTKNDIKDTQNKIKDTNNIQCQPKEETSILETIWETTKTITLAISQSMSQVVLTLAVPVILTWIFPRNNQPMIQNIPRQPNTSSEQQLIQENRQSIQQPISLNSLNLM